MGLFDKSKLANAIALAQKKQPLERVIQAIPEAALGENEMVEFNTFIAREWFSEESLLLVNALYKKVKAAYLKTYFLSLLVEHPYQTSGQREEAAEFMLKQLVSIKAHPSFTRHEADYQRFEASALIMLGRCSVEKGLIEPALRDYQQASAIANQTKNAALKSEIAFLVDEANHLLAGQQTALDELGLKLKNLDNKVADQQRLLGMSLDLGEAENRLQALQHAHAEQEEMLLDGEQRISDQTEQKNRLEEEIRLSSQKLKDAYDKKDELQNEIIGLSGAWEEYQQAQTDLAVIRQSIENERSFLEKVEAAREEHGRLEQQLQEETSRLEALQLNVIETQEQLDRLVEQVKHAGQIFEMIAEHKAEASAALDKLDDAVKRTMLYAIERTARENELTRLKASVAALKIEKEGLESQAAPAQSEAFAPAELQPEAAAEAAPAPTAGSEQNQLLDQQLTELTELFKDPGQLIASKQRGKKTRKTSVE